MTKNWTMFGEEMKGIFRKSLGFIILLATVGVATCQSMVNVISEETTEIAAKN